MSDNIVLGRGKLYFDRFATDTEDKTGERYLGSTMSFGVTAETEDLAHYNSEEGLRVKDASVTLQVDYAGSFVTDNVDLDNLGLFFFGAKGATTSTALTDETDTFTVKKGLYYQLGADANYPAGKELVSSVVSDGSFVPGTDFIVDEALGRVFIPETSAISDGTVVVFTYNVTAQTQENVVSGTSLIFGALRFISFNATGAQQNVFMAKVALRPNGEFALKGDEWQQLGFNVEVLQAGNLPNVVAARRAVAT